MRVNKAMSKRILTSVVHRQARVGSLSLGNCKTEFHPQNVHRSSL